MPAKPDSYSLSLRAERVVEEARLLAKRIDEWMGLPDKNLALDKQRAIMLLSQSRDFCRALLASQEAAPSKCQTCDGRGWRQGEWCDDSPRVECIDCDGSGEQEGSPR